MDKEQLAIARLQDAARLSEHRYKRPLMVTYSGGKDSQVLVALAERAGINFEVVNSHTTADAPETVYFIRDRFKELEERGIKCTIIMPTYKGKPVSMWTLIPQKLVPPTRIMRYCCAVLKETTGHNRFIATGVRWAESTQRKLNRGIMEINHRDKEKRIVMMADNSEKRQLFETCAIKGKMTVNPIIDWSDEDVWDYMNAERLSVNPLYCEGQKRVGCVGCPMAGRGGDNASLFAGLRMKKCIFQHLTGWWRLENSASRTEERYSRTTGKQGETVFIGGLRMAYFPDRSVLMILRRP